MDKYILDGQYGKYLEMIGIRVGEALKAAGVPEDLFSRKKPVLEEDAYYRFMEAVGSQITDPLFPADLCGVLQQERTGLPGPSGKAQADHRAHAI